MRQIPSLDRVFRSLGAALSRDKRLKRRFAREPQFERVVWDVVLERCARYFGKDTVPDLLLSSHKSLNLPGRSAEAWKRFKEQGGPNVEVLGSGRRLDMVVLVPGTRRGLGIEVECLSGKNPGNQLIVGLGQSLLALAKRDCVILIVNCPRASRKERNELREVGRRMLRQAPRLQLVVTP